MQVTSAGTTHALMHFFMFLKYNGDALWTTYDTFENELIKGIYIGRNYVMENIMKKFQGLVQM